MNEARVVRDWGRMSPLVICNLNLIKCTDEAEPHTGLDGWKVESATTLVNRINIKGTYTYAPSTTS